MKFIHIADIHLGSSPAITASWAKEREDEIWHHFFDFLEQLEKVDIDLLLIAGDLFDHVPTQEELERVNAHFSRLTHTKVIIIAGDSDYLMPGSAYETFDFCSQVSMFKKSQLTYRYLEDIDTMIYGLSYCLPENDKPMYDKILPMKRLHDGRILSEQCCHILLGHGGDAQHIPFDIDKLRRIPMTYIALGHAHAYWLDEQKPIANSGAFEPLKIEDAGPHGYIYGEYEDGNLSLEFIPFAKREYKKITVDISSAENFEALKEIVHGAIIKNGAEHIYQIVLKGTRMFHFPTDWEQLYNSSRIIKIIDQTESPFDYDAIFDYYHHQLPGLYIHSVRKMEIDDDLKEKVLAYGMYALSEQMGE